MLAGGEMVAGRRGERMAGDGCDWPRWALSLCVLRSRQASTSLSWCAMQPSSAPMLPCACIDHAALTNVPTARIFGFVYPSHIGSHAAGTVYKRSRPALSQRLISSRQDSRNTHSRRPRPTWVSREGSGWPIDCIADSTAVTTFFRTFG